MIHNQDTSPAPVAVPRRRLIGLEVRVTGDDLGDLDTLSLPR